MRLCIRCGTAPGLFANHCKACAQRDRLSPAVRRAVAERHNAAANLRALVNVLGSARCARCDQGFCAAEIEIDHVVPLASGGTDTRGNVQALCTDCHRAKTRREQGLVQ